MNRIIKSLLISFTVIFLSNGCNGGGAGGIKVPEYAGAWRGRVELVSNTCPREIPREFELIFFRHNVNQGVSGDALGNTILDVVLDDGIDTFVGIGQVDENGLGNSFSTTGTAHILPGFLDQFECQEVIDFQYDVIDFTEDDFNSAFAGFVTRHSSITCTRDEEILTCDVNYTGTAERVATNTAP